MNMIRRAQLLVAVILMGVSMSGCGRGILNTASRAEPAVRIPPLQVATDAQPRPFAHHGSPRASSAA